MSVLFDSGIRTPHEGFLSFGGCSVGIFISKTYVNSDTTPVGCKSHAILDVIGFMAHYVNHLISQREMELR